MPQPHEPGSPYRPVRQIGSGASSVIWEVTARDGRRFAAKIPQPCRTRDVLVEQARAWIELSASPCAQNCVCLQAIEDGWNGRGGCGYYVMDLVREEELGLLFSRHWDAWSRDGRLAGMLSLAAEGCVGAVSRLHCEGFLHRDLNPRHFLAGQDLSAVKLCDFDLLAKCVEVSSDRVEGTLGYLAPECLDCHYTPRTDVFALGVSLYRLAAGRLPWQRRSLRDAGDPRFWETIPPLQDSVAALSPRYRAAAQVAISFDPGERFANAAEMLDFLIDRV